MNQQRHESNTEILVVEDSLVEAELLRRILVKAGYQVRLAKDGKEGLQALREHYCALVISDIQMPLMNGYELCREIKHDEKLWNIPVILVSMLSEAEDILKALEVGADSYLTKPCVEASLLARIHSLLSIPIDRSRAEERRAEQVEYNGKRHTITTDSRQMLNLLLSVYENTLSQNQELISAQAQLNRLNNFLEDQVQNRTAALQESEARYRRIAEGLTDYQYTVRLENGQAVETTQSPACITVTGYQPGEFAANPNLWIEMVAPEDRELVTEHVRQILRGEDVPPMEHRIIRKDGETRWVRDTTILFKDASDKLLSYDGVIKDITERKRAEEARRQSEADIRTLVAHSPIAMIVDVGVDADEKILMMNQKFTDIFGYTMADVPDVRHWWTLAYPDEKYREEVSAEWLARAEKAIQNRSNIEPMEVTISCKDGSRRYVSISFASTGNKNIITFVDLSERKTEEDKLRKSEERYRSLFENMLNGYAYCRMQYDDHNRPVDFVYLDVNAAFERLTGLKNVVGKPVSELIPGIREQNPEVFDIYARVIETGVPEIFELDLKPLGLWFNVSVYSPVKEYFVAVFDEFTERKQAEIALKHVNRALNTISAVNRQLVYSNEESVLLQAICEAVVARGGYRMAWVGYAQQDADKTVKIMAHAGHDEGYLDNMRITWAESERGMGPTGRVIRSGKTQLSQDFANDSRLQLWRDAGRKNGFAASIALPLTDNDGKVFGALTVYAEEVNAFTPAEVDLLEEMAGDLAFGVRTLHVRHERDLAQKQNQHYLEQLQDSLEGTVRAIAGIVEMRDPYTAGHQARVADLASAIARQMGFSDERVQAIHLASIVHDLGKIKIPAEILSKPGKLSDIEYQLIQTHAQAGYDILKEIRFPWPIAQMALQHHERVDGTGYPQGLAGDAFMLEARILSVADVVEAMSSHRPYRAALGTEAALAEITRHRGIYFDPQVVDACLILFKEKGFAFKV